MKYLALLSFGLLGLVLGLVPLGCKDTDPCDPGQEANGTGCFPIKSDGGSAGKSSDTVEAGADAGGAAGVEPWGNPDATWGSPCTTHNADCGPDAPICLPNPYGYCSQIDCQDGEANAGVCPEMWSCLKFEPYPSICSKL